MLSTLQLVFLALCCISVFAVEPLVDLSYSKYRGVALPSGVSQWLGVRYAAVPIGDLRFAAPQDPPHNDTVQSADKHGLICLSTGAKPNDNTTSEDCLFLDVYAPSNASSASPLPVYFFIQGGGFNQNSNANYNGSGLVIASGMNIVVVNFNYRVGPYGFLASSEVEAGGSINNGLKDQRKALEWVQRYISAFGGDPGHVVLGGDSAGAASVALHLTAYGGQDFGLFHASAAESQSFATVLNVSESQYQYDNLVIRTNCASASDTLACLRSLSAHDLQVQNFNTPFPGARKPPLYMYGPTLDGDLIPDYTYRLFDQGRFIKIPVIFGDDTDEGTIFVPKNTSTSPQSDTFLQSQFPLLTLNQLATINSMYPVSNDSFPNSGPYWRQCSNAYGEIRYICPGIFISSAFSRYGVTSSWNYHYNVEDPTQVAQGLGVPHTVEVNAIWGPDNVNGGAPSSYNTSNAAIVPTIQGYWTSFVRSFNPNTYRDPGTPEWEEWTQSGYQRLLFESNGTRMETAPQDQRARCSYLSSIGLSLKQ